MIIKIYWEKIYGLIICKLFKIGTTEYEENYPTKNNDIGTYLSKKTCLRDKKGNVIGLVGISVDITKQKKLQSELEKKNIELEKNKKYRVETK